MKWLPRPYLDVHIRRPYLSFGLRVDPDPTDGLHRSSRGFCFSWAWHGAKYVKLWWLGAVCMWDIWPLPNHPRFLGPAYHRAMMGVCSERFRSPR